MGLQIRLAHTLGQRIFDLTPRGVESPLHVIGRAPDCDIPVPSVNVSRRHAMMFVHEGQWVVQDCGSGRGTFLNGEEVTEPTYLGLGDIVTLGTEKGAPTLEVDPLGVARATVPTAAVPGGQEVEAGQGEEMTDAAAYASAQVAAAQTLGPEEPHPIMMVDDEQPAAFAGMGAPAGAAVAAPGGGGGGNDWFASAAPALQQQQQKGRSAPGKSSNNSTQMVVWGIVLLFVVGLIVLLATYSHGPAPQAQAPTQLEPLPADAGGSTMKGTIFEDHGAGGSGAAAQPGSNARLIAQAPEAADAQAPAAPAADPPAVETSTPVARAGFRTAAQGPGAQAPGAQAPVAYAQAADSSASTADSGDNNNASNPPPAPAAPGDADFARVTEAHETIAIGEPEKAIVVYQDYLDQNPKSAERAKVQGFIEEGLDSLWWIRVEQLCLARIDQKQKIGQANSDMASEPDATYRKELAKQRAEAQEELDTVDRQLTEMKYKGERPNREDDDALKALRSQRDPVVYEKWKENVLRTIKRTRGVLSWKTNH